MYTAIFILGKIRDCQNPEGGIIYLHSFEEDTKGGVALLTEEHSSNDVYVYLPYLC